MTKRFKDAERYSKGSAVRHKEQIREMQDDVDTCTGCGKEEAECVCEFGARPKEGGE